MTDGGTQMYCPECEQVRTCTAVPLTQRRRGYKQRRYWDDENRDVSWFERARQCATCAATFSTAELDLALVRELMRFREAASQLGDQFRDYVEGGKQDSQALHAAVWDIAYSTGNTKPFDPDWEKELGDPSPHLRSV